MFTIDASVHINALNPAEDGSPDSQAFLERLHRRSGTVYSPTLLLVEVAAAVARALIDRQAGQAMARAVRDLSGRHWIPLGGAIWPNRLAGWQPNVGYGEQMPNTLPWPAVTAPLPSPGIASSCSASPGAVPALIPTEALAQLLERGEDEEGREA